MARKKPNDLKQNPTLYPHTHIYCRSKTNRSRASEDSNAILKATYDQPDGLRWSPEGPDQYQGNDVELIWKLFNQQNEISEILEGVSETIRACDGIRVVVGMTIGV